MAKYSPVSDYYNENEDISMFIKNITPASDKEDTNQEYYDAVMRDTDTNALIQNGGKLVPIPLTEYKNLILEDYLIKVMLRYGVFDWPKYEECIKVATGLFKKTFYAASKTVDNLNGKEESNGAD